MSDHVEGLAGYVNRCPVCQQWIAVQLNEDDDGHTLPNTLVRHKAGHKDGPPCIGSGGKAPYLGEVGRSAPAVWRRDEPEPPEPDPEAHRIGDSVSERRALDDAGRGHLNRW